MCARARPGLGLNLRGALHATRLAPNMNFFPRGMHSKKNRAARRARVKNTRDRSGARPPLSHTPPPLSENRGARMSVEDDDPFGMGPADELEAPPPLDDGLGGGGDPMAAADFGAGTEASDALPTFGDQPASGDAGLLGGDMGGAAMPDDGGMGGMGGGMGVGGGLSDEFAGEAEVGAVAKWRIENAEKVAAKNAAAAEYEAATRAEAEAAIAEFYAKRTETNEKRAAENREAEREYVAERDAAMMEDNWDSVCKLVDMKEKAGAETDMSRMRSLLTQLKHT